MTLGHLKEADPPNPFAGLFGGGAPSSKEAGEAADTYIFINATCVELLNVRAYVEKVCGLGVRHSTAVLSRGRAHP